jgi:hypothetical protein
MRVQEFYETTLRALEKARNDRLWFKTNLKLVGLWFKAREYGRMHKILKDLHRCGTLGARTAIRKCRLHVATVAQYIAAALFLHGLLVIKQLNVN